MGKVLEAAVERFKDTRIIPTARVDALWEALGQMRTTPEGDMIREALMTVLRRPTDSGIVRSAAATGLSRITIRAAEQRELIAIFSDRYNPYNVKQALARLLCEARIKAAVPALGEVMSDPKTDYGVRLTIASRIGDIGDDRAIPYLNRVVAENATPIMVRVANNALISLQVRRDKEAPDETGA